MLASAYPVPWANPDREDAAEEDLVRRPIIASITGKVPPPRPSSTTQSHSALSGATIRPTSPQTKNSTNVATSQNGLRSRSASGGARNAAGRLSTPYSASHPPASD